MRVTRPGPQTKRVEPERDSWECLVMMISGKTQMPERVRPGGARQLHGKTLGAVDLTHDKAQFGDRSLFEGRMRIRGDLNHSLADKGKADVTRQRKSLGARGISYRDRHLHLSAPPTHRFHTITSDNGTEFHCYRQIEAATGVRFYFATPHHAWERGTSENTNGLIRQYLPRRQSMVHLTQKQCDQIAQKLNDRPRKRHAYKTPRNCFLST